MNTKGVFALIAVLLSGCILTEWVFNAMTPNSWGFILVSCYSLLCFWAVTGPKSKHER